MKISLEQQIRVAERELQMRKKVYPRRVESGAMTEAEAEFQTAAMAAIVETLRQLQPAQQERLF